MRKVAIIAAGILAGGSIYLYTHTAGDDGTKAGANDWQEHVRVQTADGRTIWVKEQGASATITPVIDR